MIDHLSCSCILVYDFHHQNGPKCLLGLQPGPAIVAAFQMAGGRKEWGCRGPPQLCQFHLTIWPPQNLTPYFWSHGIDLNFVWSLLAAGEIRNSILLVWWIAACIQTASVSKQRENENCENYQCSLPTQNSKMRRRRWGYFQRHRAFVHLPQPLFSWCLFIHRQNKKSWFQTRIYEWDPCFLFSAKLSKSLCWLLSACPL